jgi:hypothetical protein
VQKRASRSRAEGVGGEGDRLDLVAVSGFVRFRLLLLLLLRNRRS